MRKNELLNLITQSNEQFSNDLKKKLTKQFHLRKIQIEKERQEHLLIVDREKKLIEKKIQKLNKNMTKYKQKIDKNIEQLNKNYKKIENCAILLNDIKKRIQNKFTVKPNKSNLKNMENDYKNVMEEIDTFNNEKIGVLDLN